MRISSRSRQPAGVMPPTPGSRSGSTRGSCEPVLSELIRERRGGETGAVGGPSHLIGSFSAKPSNELRTSVVARSAARRIKIEPPSEPDQVVACRTRLLPLKQRRQPSFATDLAMNMAWERLIHPQERPDSRNVREFGRNPGYEVTGPNRERSLRGLVGRMEWP